MIVGLQTVAIIGVGLLGGSLGLALKARGFRGTVRGVGRRQSSLDVARGIGAIDETYLEAPAAVDGAGLVVICTPAALVSAKLDEIRAACQPGTVVTDVASTKGVICAHAEATWTSPRYFVGSHPMAGSEKFGPEHADPNLYEGSITFVEDHPHLAPGAKETVVALWRAVGSKTIDVDPHRHDAFVARTSHLPHIVAAALAQVAVEAGEGLHPFVGKGFRDTTRIAAGRAEIWRDICTTNNEAILSGLDSLLDTLTRFRETLSRDDAQALEAFFDEGQSARDRALRQ